jgi:two-component system chemotaxis response regulator CheB
LQAKEGDNIQPTEDAAVDFMRYPFVNLFIATASPDTIDYFVSVQPVSKRVASMMHRKKVLIVDSSAIYRRELKTIIETRETLVDVHQARDADQVQEVLRNLDPDAAFVEIDLPVDESLSMIEAVRNAAPDCRIVLLTDNDSEACRDAAMELAVDAFLSKEEATGLRLIDVIHAVVRR